MRECVLRSRAAIADSLCQEKMELPSACMYVHDFSVGDFLWDFFAF